jgi:hypothetical protein
MKKSSLLSVLLLSGISVFFTKANAEIENRHFV